MENGCRGRFAPEYTATPPANTAQPPSSDTDAYGPWMVVEQCERRPALTLQTNGFMQSWTHPRGSRFNPISEEIDDDVQEFAKDVDPAHEGIPRICHDDHQHKGKAIAIPK
ncbi:hypothetical protein V6N13_041422 [Hibiscus sabdariffa]